MNKVLVFCIIIYTSLTCCACAFAQDFNFDNLNSDSGNNSKKSQVIKGANSLSKDAIKRQKSKWQEETQREEEERQKSYDRYKAERALGNGRRYYDCTFICRNSGFINYESTEKITWTVKADESLIAENIASKDAEEYCKDMRASNGDLMYVSGLMCSENFSK